MAAAGWAILGAGAIGQLCAHALPRAQTTLLLRPSALQPLQQQQQELVLEDASGVKMRSLVHVGSATARGPPIQHLLVATKAYDVVEAVRSVQHRLLPHSCIVLIQNGLLAVYSELWRAVLSPLHASARAHGGPPPRVLLGSLTHGCFRAAADAPFRVVHAGAGTCSLAEVDAGLPCLTDPRHQRMWDAPPSAPLRALLGVDLLAPSHVPSHRALLQQLQLKLAANCAINPLTAVLGCRNGQLLAHAHTRDAMRSVCAELHAWLGQGAVVPRAELEDNALAVAEATGGNKSSMWQDLLARRRTEIDYLNGYVVRNGAPYKVPLNRLLTQLVKFKEAEAVGSAQWRELEASRLQALASSRRSPDLT